MNHKVRGLLHIPCFLISILLFSDIIVKLLDFFFFFATDSIFNIKQGFFKAVCVHWDDFLLCFENINRGGLLIYSGDTENTLNLCFPGRQPTSMSI